MGRHNRPKKRRQRPLKPLDRYNNAYVDMPERPELRYLIVKPFKTVFTNIAAVPEAVGSYTVKRYDDKLLKVIQRYL